MSQPRITRMQAGKDVDVPIEEVWDSICKVLRIARLLTSPNGEKYQEARLAFLAERLCDIESLSFHYCRRPFSTNIAEQFIPASSEK